MTVSLIWSLGLAWALSSGSACLCCWNGILPISRAVDLRRWGGLSGLSFHGGVIGVVAGLLVVRRYGVNPWHMADLVAPLLALGTGIARFGCLLNGCCYGYASSVPWAFPCAAVDSLPRHPTQLYAVVGNLLIFAWLWRRRGKLEYRGENALGYVIAYAVMRSVVEVWRDSQILFAPFKTTQVANAVIILLALIVNWRLAQNRQRQGEGWAGE